MKTIKKIDDTTEKLEKALQKIARQLDTVTTPQEVTLLHEAYEKTLVKHKKLVRLFQKQNKAYAALHEKNRELQKENDALISDNYLLEYKKKELLMITHELEEANEYIAQKNIEIQEQSDELEAQKDAIQDQADYLHEINERISAMHTEMQSQRDEILRKNQELISLNNEKSNLISIVAHDLKSPLSQIDGLISLLNLTAQLEGESKQFLDTMSHSVKRLVTMIAKILDVEAIESKKLNLQMEKVDLMKVVKPLLVNYTLTASQKNIEIRSTLPSDGAFAEVDNSFVSQVYENLLSNAIKFSPPDKQIFVTLTLINNTWRFEIKDQGPGISEADQQKLFVKFQKLSAKPTGNETSTGLGLSIVKKYVDAMNGKIWCESQINQGASFMVEFAKAK